MEGGERKLYIPDTNILVTNPAAPMILTGNADMLSELGVRGLDQLVAKEYRERQPPNDLVLPQMVEFELGTLARDDDRPSSIRFNARLAKKMLSALRREGTGRFYSGEPIRLPNGACVAGIRHNEEHFEHWARNRYRPSGDDRILWALHRFLEANPDSFERTCFITEDRAFRDLVFEEDFDGRFLRAEGFRFEQVDDPHQRYTGNIVCRLPMRTFRQLRAADSVSLDDLGLEEGLLEPNQIVTITPRSQHNKKYFFINRASSGSIDQLTNYQWVMDQLRTQPWVKEKIVGNPNDDPGNYQFGVEEDHERLRSRLLSTRRVAGKDRKALKRVKLPFKTREQMGRWKRKLAAPDGQAQRVDDDTVLYTPINADLVPEDEQKPYVELLAADKIPVVSTEASHGGGKTLLAVLVGALKVNAGVYNGITYIRPMKTIGEDLGTLPGGKGAKLSRFMVPIEDALQEIFRYHDVHTARERKVIQDQIEHLQGLGFVQYEVASDIGGRTIRRQFIIVDEAHLYTRAQVGMLLQRVGRGSKIAFVGDLGQLESYYNDTRLVRFLNSRTSGLAHLPERLKGEKLYGHIALPSRLIKRSDASALALRLGGGA